MNRLVDLDRFKYELALKKWQTDCRQRMTQRYPAISFDADRWPLKEASVTGSPNFTFTSALLDFADKHTSFAEAFRCLVAEAVLGEKIKGIGDYSRMLRLLRFAPVETLFDLDYASLHAIETASLQQVRDNPGSAHGILTALNQLARTIDTLTAKGLIPRLRYRIRQETRSGLRALSNSRLKQSRQARTDALDRMIEALNEAFNALFADDPRLSAGDRVALATMGLTLCAPSRINEVLCLSIDDHVSVDDYARRANDKEVDAVHAAHQMLLITMKGSKGAQWSAKPVLNFMIEFYHYCLNIILEHGERSRMLVRWYQQHPGRLYLPSELEYLRDSDLTVRSLANIMALSADDNDSSYQSALKLMQKLGNRRFKIPNPNPINKNGVQAARTQVDAVRWDDIEPLLLDNIRTELASCRIVTFANHYQGKLEKMLFLFDHDESPYIPGAARYDYIKHRLKQTATERQNMKRNPTLFEKLNITMPINGFTQIAEICTHTPRRWLTTMALTYGEKLSSILINKWANRLNIAQLWHYDFRSAETRAIASGMPEPVELAELSKGLTSCRQLEDEYGPRTDIVSIHDASIKVTTMESIYSSTEDRPIAKTGEQIIIIYPTWYGFCTHQHHEKPCRAYTSCLPCNNNHLVKGHIPTNKRVRERASELHAAILNIVEQMVIVHNREIADDQEALAHHICHLVERGLTPAQMAEELISQFHLIKHLIKDVVLKNMIHEAFVATGFVDRLDDPATASGALMKYNNPRHHAAPGVERAIDTRGGHELIEQERLAMLAKYPHFSPVIQGLKDQQSLLTPDDDNAERDELQDGTDE